MTARGKPVTILIADDDPDDRMLTKDAVGETDLSICLRFVENGEELLDYLHRRGRYVNQVDTPRPGLILLDLNMPKKDGREALMEIKADPELRRIPIVILTTSQAEEDVLGAYSLGVNSFIVKPVTFEGLVETMATLIKYWFNIVQLPPDSK